MNVIINGVDLWELDPMRYWVHPKSYDVARQKAEAKQMVLSGDYIGSRKMDGIWSMVIKDCDGNFHLRSRTKNVEGTYADKADWIPTITKELENLPNGTVILGEIYKYGDEGSRKATSILNCLKTKSLERQQKTPLHLYIFDVLMWNSENLIDSPITKRIEYIEKIKNGHNVYVEFAHYVEKEELWNLYTDTIAEGGEGIVILRKTAPYSCGKRKARDSLKMKKALTDTIDAFIDGDYKPATVEYTGKNIETWNYWLNQRTGEKFEGQLIDRYTSGEPIIPITKSYFLGYAGAISFSLMKDDVPKHLCWISGVPDEFKKGIVVEPEKWVGRVFEISAMQLEKIEGEYSLRHAKVMQERNDKTINDCLWEQIADK